MKFVQVHKLVALCLCLGIVRTSAQNLKSRLLNEVCIEEGLSCSCCDGLHCVKAVGLGGYTCERTGHGQGIENHCIPESKQCNNGNAQFDCCDGSFCVLQENGKHKCAPFIPENADCNGGGDCCGDLLCCNEDADCCSPNIHCVENRCVG